MEKFLQFFIATGMANLALLGATLPQTARAENSAIVFQVKKTLPLNDTEKINHDYYLSLGTDGGIKVGTLITVYRRTPAMDNYLNRSRGDFSLAVGVLKIIYAQRDMSIGRVYKINEGANVPVIDYEAIMMGDRVEISGDQQTGDSAKAAENTQAPSVNPEPQHARKIASQEGQVALAEKLPEPASRHDRSAEQSQPKTQSAVTLSRP